MKNIEIDSIECGFEGSDTVEVEYSKIKAVTSAAVLFDIDGGNCWIPKSQLVEITEDNFLVTRWFAKKEELI